MANEFRRRVADILQTEHRISQARLSGLSVKDTNELRSIAIGERSLEHRIKALGVLAATRDPAATDVFRRALRDTAARFEVRAAGATWLSRLGGMSAEGDLIAGLAVEEMPAVQHKIVAGLARVGSETCLRRLAESAQALDPAVRDHARFAQAVIACRAGIGGFELPGVDASLRLPAPPEALVSARMTAARPEDGLRVIEQTAGDSYQIAGDPQSVALVLCGRRNLAAVIHPSWRRGPGDLLARPSLAGYVATQAETDGSYSTCLLALTWPDESGGVHVSVNRPSGRTEYFGEGRIEGDIVRFKLDAVRAPGATETTVTGALIAGRIAELQILSGRTMERMRPTPVEDR